MGAPDYLDGSMMGDYGFDPLRLARNTQQLPYYREAELMNGRYAMLACAGILLTELGGLPLFTEAGEKALESSPFDLKTLVFIQVPFMAWFEYKRWDSWQRTGDISVNGVALGPPQLPVGPQPAGGAQERPPGHGGLPRVLLAGGVPGEGAHRVPDGPHGGPGAPERVHLQGGARGPRRGHGRQHRPLRHRGLQEPRGPGGGQVGRPAPAALLLHREERLGCSIN